MAKQSSISTGQTLGRQTHGVSGRNKKIGLFFLVGPVSGLIAVFAMYIIASVMYEASPSIFMHRIMIFLSFIGLVCFIGIFIGIPLGIVYLRKNKLSGSTKERNL